MEVVFSLTVAIAGFEPSLAKYILWETSRSQDMTQSLGSAFGSKSEKDQLRILESLQRPQGVDSSELDSLIDRETSDALEKAALRAIAILLGATKEELEARVKQLKGKAAAVRREPTPILGAQSTPARPPLISRRAIQLMLEPDFVGDVQADLEGRFRQREGTDELPAQ